MSGQLYVRYGHLDPNAAPRREFHVHGDMIAVEAVDPEAHAKAAPGSAEWFQYFVRTPDGMYSPDGATYYLDATPHQHGDYTVVDLRRCGVIWPYYQERPDLNEVVSSR